MCIRDRCEARAERMGGWTTARHTNYPTTDVPIQELPDTLEWFREKALPETLYPFLANAYGRRAGVAPSRVLQRKLPRFVVILAINTRVRRTHMVQTFARTKRRERLTFLLPPSSRFALPNAKNLRVVDGFVVKYNATAGQSFLKPHRDGSVVSFNIALNGLDEYEGGGTWIARLDDSADMSAGNVRSDRGHVLAHASGMLHGGHHITSGVRYILVCFVILKEYANFAVRFYERVRDLDPEHLEPMPALIET